MEADYIIIGAGSAGCVVASRLSENPNNKVILIEAGGSDKNWVFSMPLAWLQAVANPKYGWGYFTEPEPNMNNRILPILRGKVMGGCSSVNGMMHARGQPQDFDTWEKMGLKGWSYKDVLPYFIKSENNWRGKSEIHGNDGPLSVSRMHSLDQNVTRELLQTANGLGLDVIDDFANGDGLGFCLCDFTVHKGTRASTSARYINPFTNRNNLEILTDTLTTKIILEGKKAVGVEILRDGQKQIIKANHEIIISGGAINSPQILMLSGIGPAQELKALGIDPIIDLQGVGKNLQEHTSIINNYHLKKEIGFEKDLRWDRLMISVMQWFLTKSGPAAAMPFGAQGFYKLFPESDRPDVQFIMTPVSKMANPWFPGLIKGKGHQLSTVGVQMHPKSRGWVKLRSANPVDTPRILLNMLDDEYDLMVMREIIRWGRKFLQSSPANEIIGDEITPGYNINSDAELDAYIRENVETSFHPVGTCSMGIDEKAVVDNELKVRGIDGLRIADASIMPTLTGGNTNVPIIMIGEKAADMILGKGQI